MHRVMSMIRSMYARIKNTRGFSLVDVIVAVSIVMMITGVSISYNRSSEQQLRIFKSQAVLVGAINRAKSYATERFIGRSVPSGAFACAFGVHLDAAARKVTIFQDIKSGTDIYTCLNSDGTYTPSEDFYGGASEIVEEVVLDPYLTMTVLSNGLSVPTQDILFVPPDILVMTNLNFPVTVGLSGASAGYSSTTISFSGQITTR